MADRSCPARHRPPAALMVVAYAVLVIAALVGGCSAPKGEAFAPINISSVRVTPASGTLIVGDVLTLVAVALDAAGNQLPGRPMSWTSSSVAIATVSLGGAVQAISPGLATISAASEGRVGFAAITVTKVPVVSVSVLPGALTMDVGQAVQLTVVPKDQNGTPLLDRQPTFTSDNQSVVSVSATGLVTARGAGNATVLVTVDAKTALTQVSVRTAIQPVAFVSVTPAQLAMSIGESATVQTIVTDAGGGRLNDRSTLWSTNNAAVAVVSSSGIVTGTGAGTARITGTVDGKSGGADVTVSQAVQTVASITLDQANLTLLVNGFGQLRATPLDAQGRALGSVAVTWTSSAPSVAGVTSTGLVTAQTNGSAVITASAGGKSATAAVTVTTSTVGSGVLSRIDVAPFAGTYVVGDTGAFAFLPLSGDGTTVVIPPGSFSASASSAIIGRQTQCSSLGCLQRLGFTLADGQQPQVGYISVFATNGNGSPSGRYLVTVISNVLDSLVLQGPGRAAGGVPAGSSSVSVNANTRLYPYVFYKGGYTQATNAEYTVTAGVADVTRCTETLGNLRVQSLCANVVPRAAGTVTVQARLRKSDGTYWTSSITFTAQ